MSRKSLFRPTFDPIPRTAETSSRKALLLRVGMDRGTGGALGPVFPNGTFEYIPIPEEVPTRSPFTYASLPGRYVPSLAAVLPPRLARRRPHVDPDFTTITYGDAAPRKRQQLLRLASGDVLVFYAGLSPRPPEDRSRLFGIGFLHVKHVHHLHSRDLGRRDLQQKFGHTAHFLRRVRDEEIALVEGDPRESRLLARALPLGDPRDCLLRDLASIGYQGSLLRSVGHWIKGACCLALLDAWLRHGPAMLVDRETRLIAVDSSAIRVLPDGGDLAVVGHHLREGDWIIALAEHRKSDVRAFGRINRAPEEKDDPARSSLFWFFLEGGPGLRLPVFRHLAPDRTVSDTVAIRRLVSWFDRHYRVGFHGRAEIGLSIHSR